MFFILLKSNVFFSDLTEEQDSVPELVTMADESMDHGYISSTQDSHNGKYICWELMITKKKKKVDKINVSNFVRWHGYRRLG